MPDMSILQQMNSLMEEKEAVFQKREEQLQAHHKRLKEFELQLTKKARSLQDQQKELEEREAELQRKQKELEAYEKNMTESMEMVLSEKVRLESKNKEQLENILQKEEKRLKDEWENSELGQLGTSLGIAMPDMSGDDVIQPEDVGKVENMEKAKKDIPQLFEDMKKAVKEKYPKWRVIEVLPELLCVQAGDKEIRIFDQQPIPMAQIFMYKRKARTDTKIQAKMVSISRVEPEWSITCEDNSIVCSMSFQKETDVALVLEKCHQFIKNHL